MLKKFLSKPIYKRCLVFAAVFALTAAVIGMQDLQPELPVDEVTAETLSESAAIHASVVSAGVAGELGASQFYVVQETGTLMGPQLLEATLAPANMVAYRTPGFVYLDSIPMSVDLQRYAYEASEAAGVEYELVLAIMWRESRFQADAVNVNADGTKDSGLMQINDVNRDWLEREHGIDDLLDPYQNIDAGIAILQMFFGKYPETQALLAYQYGEGGMLERREQGLVTNDLTVLVQQKRDEYRGLLSAAEPERYN